MDNRLDPYRTVKKKIKGKGSFPLQPLPGIDFDPDYRKDVVTVNSLYNIPSKEYFKKFLAAIGYHVPWQKHKSTLSSVAENDKKKREREVLIKTPMTFGSSFSRGTYYLVHCQRFLLYFHL